MLQVSQGMAEVTVGRKRLDNLLDAVKVPLRMVNHALEQLNNRPFIYSLSGAWYRVTRRSKRSAALPPRMRRGRKNLDCRRAAQVLDANGATLERIGHS